MNLNLVKDQLWKGGACTNLLPTLSHWNKQLGQAQTVPVGQADWDRLCLSQWDRQAACTKPVPPGLGKVKRDLSCPMEQVMYPSWRPFLVPGQALYPQWSLSQFHLSQLVPQSGGSIVESTITFEGSIVWSTIT